MAISKLESSLHADLSTAQWVINGYALVFGVMIAFSLLGLNTAIITSASSLPSGISAAFTVDAVLAGVGMVAFVYCGTPAEHAEQRRRLLRHLHRAHA